MRAEFLDFVEDILDAIGKAEILLTDVRTTSLRAISGSTMPLSERSRSLAKRPSGCPPTCAISILQSPGREWLGCEIGSSTGTIW